MQDVICKLNDLPSTPVNLLIRHAGSLVIQSRRGRIRAVSICAVCTIHRGYSVAFPGFPLCWPIRPEEPNWSAYALVNSAPK